jgi:hypothetical protein
MKLMFDMICIYGYNVMIINEKKDVYINRTIVDE